MAVDFTVNGNIVAVRSPPVSIQHSVFPSDLPPICRWEDVAEPKGAVHVIHGLAEHPERYERLARALNGAGLIVCCLLYTSPSPRDRQKSRMPSSA